MQYIINTFNVLNISKHSAYYIPGGGFLPGADSRKTASFARPAPSGGPRRTGCLNRQTSSGPPARPPGARAAAGAVFRAECWAGTPQALFFAWSAGRERRCAYMRSGAFIPSRAKPFLMASLAAITRATLAAFSSSLSVRMCSSW